MSNSCCGGSGVTGLCGACGCNPCSCIYQNIFQTGGSGSPATAGQCVNLSGICVLDAYNANTMYFRGVASANAILTVSLDATNHVILLDLDINALTAALPQATTTQAGVGETATDAEAQAKASTTVFLTPSNLAALGASTTFAGFLEIATDAEAIAGASTTLAITPSNLAATIAANYGTTVTFADAVARNAAVPAFVGQFGYQQDALNAYAGSALVAGSWGPLVTLGGTADGTDLSTTLGLGTVGQFIFSGTGDVKVSGCVLKLINGGYLDMDNSAGFAFSGSITNNSFVTNNGFGAGAPLLISAVATTQNIDTGWSGFTNSAVRKTGDCNTITLPQLAQVVDTLINTLKVPQLPAT